MHLLQGIKLFDIRGFGVPSAVACLIAAASLAFTGCAVNSATPVQRSNAVPVTVAKASQRSVPIDIQVIGNVEAYSTIGVKSLIGGQLQQVNFREGDYVKKGQLLFKIDPRPLEAQVHQMEANQLRDTALLKQAEANLLKDSAQESYARAESVRYAQLFRQGVISKELDDQYAANAGTQHNLVEADRASIESAKAAIEADKANLENARVQLSYSDIYSPIDGRTGNLAIKQGNVVKASDIDIVTINQLAPIYVTFTVPESQLAEIKRRSAAGKLLVLAAPQGEGETGLETGALTFIDNAVDLNTGTIKLKGTFPNTDHKLWPGQFVRVTLRLATLTDAVVVPTQAIQTGQEGQFVFVVKPDMTVESRPVTPGVRAGEDQVIDRGIAGGETVVTEGQLRLVPGSRVQIKTAQGSGSSD